MFNIKYLNQTTADAMGGVFGKRDEYRKKYIQYL